VGDRLWRGSGVLPEEAAHLPVHVQCRVTGLTCQGFDAWLPRPPCVRAIEEPNPKNALCERVPVGKYRR
jgi:hypothetical protein